MYPHGAPNDPDFDDDFYEWLNQCPVMWQRMEKTDDHAIYSFVIPITTDDEE